MKLFKYFSIIATTKLAIIVKRSFMLLCFYSSFYNTKPSIHIHQKLHFTISVFFFFKFCNRKLSTRFLSHLWQNYLLSIFGFCHQKLVGKVVRTNSLKNNRSSWKYWDFSCFCNCRWILISLLLAANFVLFSVFCLKKVSWKVFPSSSLFIAPVHGEDK